MHPNPRIIAPILLLIAVTGGAAWYFAQGTSATADDALSASGTIEGTQIVIAPEVGGRVGSVLVREGDLIEYGQELVRFNDALLKAEFSQAEASLETAQANYALVAAGPTEEQRDLAIASAEMELVNAQQALEALYDNAGVTEAGILQVIAATDKARDDARQYLDNIEGDADPADIDAAWASVVIAQDKLEKAQEAFAPYEKKDESNVTRAILLAQLAATQQQYDTMVYRYNNLVGASNRYVLAVAEADLSLAEARLEDAYRQYEELIEGIDPDALALAQARVNIAEANLASAKAEPSSEQLAVAQAQVHAAESALEVLQTQLDKLVITAPAEGVVLTRAVEPGEVMVSGAPLLTLLRIDDLTITVYIPEERYGLIQLGQLASVTVDSYPGEVFEAKVVRIADQAEFTPRNVQTEEGRRTTVFAIELVLADPDGMLKPGMPADLEFR
jgi:HlyD family secretion protein